MKKIIVLNHKTYLSLNDVKNYPVDINDYIRNDQEVIICPSSIYIPYFTGKYNFKLGIQDISNFEITGEITGKIVKSFDIKYALVGHNERKSYLNESSKLINSKIKEAQKYNITPIIIIGETYYENELRKTGEVIIKTLKEYLKDVDDDIIIAYEPNWSFENGQIPTIDHIDEVIRLIKSIVIKKYNKDIMVLYGGNITKDNILFLEKIKVLDGYLIGKNSSKVSNIIQILNEME